MTNLNSKLATLKGLDFDAGTVSLWIVKSRTQDGKMKYTCRWVDIDDDHDSNTYLAGKLKNIVVDTISSHDTIETYDFIAKPEEKTFLTMASSETNMTTIQEKVDEPGNEHVANIKKHVLNSTGYVIKIQMGDQYVYAYTKTSGSWNTKKVSAQIFSTFTGEKMIGLSDEEIFRIEKRVDFISYGNDLFIANKRAFESAMNFKDGMKKKKDQLIQEFETLDLFSSTDLIKEFVGEDARYLRSMSSIHDKEFYKDEQFMGNLRAHNRSENWGLNINDDGLIIPEAEKIRLLLTLLNDLRLKSMLSGNMYDASSSTRVDKNTNNDTSNSTSDIGKKILALADNN